MQQIQKVVLMNDENLPNGYIEAEAAMFPKGKPDGLYRESLIEMYRHGQLSKTIEISDKIEKVLKK